MFYQTYSIIIIRNAFRWFCYFIEFESSAARFENNSISINMFVFICICWAFLVYLHIYSFFLLCLLSWCHLHISKRTSLFPPWMKSSGIEIVRCFCAFFDFQFYIILLLNVFFISLNNFWLWSKFYVLVFSHLVLSWSRWIIRNEKRWK